MSQPTSHIDTHFHAIPEAYAQALDAAGQDPAGFPTPQWSIEAAIKSLDSMGSSKGIMSISSPGVPIVGTGPQGRQLARTINDEFGGYATDEKLSVRLGFFGTLPDWRDVEGTLAEIDYLFSTQKLCSGVGVLSSYGGILLGDATFAPIWAKLNSYKALIFLHPGILDVIPKFISGTLAQPIVDYPLATTRCAVDLIMSGTMTANPDVDIILSHAGGTLPYIGQRVIGSVMTPEISSKVQVNPAQAKAAVSRFYYDIAISMSPAQLHGLLDFTTPEKILYGSDFPYLAPGPMQLMYGGYQKFVAMDPRGKLLAPEKLRDNAVTLLNKHAPSEQHKL